MTAIAATAGRAAGWGWFSVLLATAVTSVSHAQKPTTTTDYPVRPLRFVVGLAPGGAADIVARLVAHKLAEPLGQPVVVDNRTGAAGSIAASLVAKAPPDGYTVLAVSSSFGSNPSLYKLPYDTIRDFAPIVQTAQAAFLLVITPSLPAKSVKELIALAKAKPGALHFSSGGKGGAAHLSGELFIRMAGIEATHVPFKGGAPSVVAIMSGEVQFTFSSIVASLPHSRAGKLRALAVSSLKRSAAAPDLPTVSEAGVPGYESITWYGLLAPAGTPSRIVNKLNREVVECREDGGRHGETARRRRRAGRRHARGVRPAASVRNHQVDEGRERRGTPSGVAGLKSAARRAREERSREVAASLGVPCCLDPVAVEWARHFIELRIVPEHPAVVERNAPR